MTNIEIVNSAIKETIGEPDLPIEENMSLKDDLGMDSLDLVDMGMRIERDLNMGIPDDELETWITVEDVYKTINEMNHE